MTDFVKIQNTLVRRGTIVRAFVKGNIVNIVTFDYDNETVTKYKYKNKQEAIQAIEQLADGANKI